MNEKHSQPAKQKDTDHKGEQRVKDSDKDKQRGKTGQMGETTQSEGSGVPKDGGESGENAGI